MTSTTTETLAEPDEGDLLRTPGHPRPLPGDELEHPATTLHPLVPHPGRPRLLRAAVALEAPVAVAGAV